ncbi:MAG TPA: ATP-binding protein [Thermoanaerobaculia bacterium]
MNLALALLIGITIGFILGRRRERRIRRSLISLEDGLRAFRDADFGMRLASPERDPAGTVKRLYNDVANTLRTQRNDIYQKELLLDTILQRTPVAVVLVNAADRIVFSNAAARELFARGARVDGHEFREILDRVVVPLRDAVLAGGDGIVTVPTAEHEETFHLSSRAVYLNTQQHRLVLVERLTPELRRQEVAVWKKAIRMINHELNNTIAPISSLFHSARRAQERPEHRHKLAEIYETIEERLGYLRAFLESYAQFARLPEPRKEPTVWADLLADVHALYDFRMDGRIDDEVRLDRAQMQQVLINLVKNAHESGSDPDAIVVKVQRVPDGSILRVSDRGRGMSEEVMRQALLPFYTTKPEGTGLGLALCNEIVEAHGGRLRLEAAPEGGTTVTLWLPA